MENNKKSLNQRREVEAEIAAMLEKRLHETL